VDVNELESRLEALLAEAGCSTYGVRDLHRDTKLCRDDIYADNVAHGQSSVGSFYNFIVADGVAVFTFFESDFSVYVVGCDEQQLIAETISFALADTDACKSLLANQYGKPEPDLTVSRGMAEHWLSLRRPPGNMPVARGHFSLAAFVMQNRPSPRPALVIASCAPTLAPGLDLRADRASRRFDGKQTARRSELATFLASGATGLAAPGH
jgi:hypothetical protein